MKTREQFIDKWKRHLAGMALFGAVSDRNDGPMSRAGKIFELPDEITKLLGAMFDDIGIPAAAAPGPPAKQPINGNTTLPKQTVKT